MAMLTEEQLNKLRTTLTETLDRLAYDALAFNTFPGFVFKKRAQPDDGKPLYPGPQIAPLVVPGHSLTRDEIREVAMRPGAIVSVECLASSVEDFAGPSLTERARRDVEQIAKAFDERWEVCLDVVYDELVGRLPRDEGIFTVTREAIEDNVYCRVATELLLERRRQIEEKREVELTAARKAQSEKLQAESRELIAKIRAEQERERCREDPPHRILARRAPGHI